MLDGDMAVVMNPGEVAVDLDLATTRSQAAPDSIDRAAEAGAHPVMFLFRSGDVVGMMNAVVAATGVDAEYVAFDAVVFVGDLEVVNQSVVGGRQSNRTTGKRQQVMLGA